MTSGGGTIILSSKVVFSLFARELALEISEIMVCVGNIGDGGLLYSDLLSSCVDSWIDKSSLELGGVSRN